MTKYLRLLPGFWGFMAPIGWVSQVSYFYYSVNLLSEVVGWVVATTIHNHSDDELDIEGEADEYQWCIFSV